MVVEVAYGVLNSTLGILFRLTGVQPLDTMVGIFLVAALLSALILIIQAKVVDQKEMREIKGRMAKHQDKMRDAQKKDNAKEISRIQKEMLQDQSKMMNMSFKPMLYYFPPIVIIFSWLGSTLPANTYLVTLPFVLPYFGSQFGWLGWYIMCSFASSPILKKIMNVE